jgi:hypothetical protein
MNGWRWIGVFLLAAGLIAYGLSASAQDTTKKDTKVDTTKEKGKTDTTKEKGKTDTSKEKEKGKTDTGKEKEKEKAGGKEGEISPKAFEGVADAKENEKRVFYQEVHTVTEQEMTVMENIKHKQKQDQKFWFSWTPKEKTKNGDFVVVQKILGVNMDIDIATNKISYHSTDPQQAKNPMSEFFKALIGTEFTLTIGKEGNRYVVKDVKGVTELVDKLGKVNNAMKPLLERILTPDTIKQMAEPMLGVIPPGGEPAKEWKSSNELNMGPIGKYATTNAYTPEGKEEKGDLKGDLKIKVSTDLKYSAPSDKEAGLPFKIQSAKLESGKDSGGTIYWDLAKGRVAAADMTIKLGGTLKIEIANMSTTVTLDQTQTTKLKTSDKNLMPTK